MTLTIDEEAGERLKTLAAEHDCEPSDYVADLIKGIAARNGSASNGTHGSWPAIDMTNGGIQPGFIADPRERMAAYLASSWPGDETEEEMIALADEIDD